MHKVTGIMSTGGKSSRQAEYAPLDRGDNELIGVDRQFEKVRLKLYTAYKLSAELRKVLLSLK